MKNSNREKNKLQMTVSESNALKKIRYRFGWDGKKWKNRSSYRKKKIEEPFKYYPEEQKIIQFLYEILGLKNSYYWVNREKNRRKKFLKIFLGKKLSPSICRRFLLEQNIDENLRKDSKPWSKKWKNHTETSYYL